MKHSLHTAWFFTLVIASIASEPVRAELRVSSDFESGSATVLAIDAAAQAVRITPAGDVARGMPSWWYCRVDGVDPNKPVSVEVVARATTVPSDDGGTSRPLAPSWTLPDRAAFSTDGVAWKQTDPGRRSGDRAVYEVKAGAKTLWLAWGPPFTPADAEAFVRQIAKEHRFAEMFTLSKSREAGVPALRIAEAADGSFARSTTRPAVWVHARNHAWEVGGSWVAVGLAEWLASDDEPARRLRRTAEVIVVPIMDVDHVATGDGGKHALPQDHNRDWSDKPHWPEVAAAQKIIRAFAAERRMSLFLDLHNPAASARDESFYVLAKPNLGTDAQPRQRRFLQLATAQFGRIREIDATPPPAARELIHTFSAPWASEHGNADTVAFCVETPWNIPAGTPDGYRAVGAKLGQVVERLLRDGPN